MVGITRSKVIFLCVACCVEKDMQQHATVKISKHLEEEQPCCEKTLGGAFFFTRTLRYRKIPNDGWSAILRNVWMAWNVSVKRILGSSFDQAWNHVIRMFNRNSQWIKIVFRLYIVLYILYYKIANYGFSLNMLDLPAFQGFFVDLQFPW